MNADTTFGATGAEGMNVAQNFRSELRAQFPVKDRPLANKRRKVFAVLRTLSGWFNPKKPARRVAYHLIRFRRMGRHLGYSVLSRLHRHLVSFNRIAIRKFVRFRARRRHLAFENKSQAVRRFEARQQKRFQKTQNRLRRYIKWQVRLRVLFRRLLSLPRTGFRSAVKGVTLLSNSWKKSVSVCPKPAGQEKDGAENSAPAVSDQKVSGKTGTHNMPGKQTQKSNFDHFWSGIISLPRSVIFASLLINIMGLALPLVMLQVYDRILPNQSVETLAFLMMGLGSVVLLDGVLKAMRSYIMGWAATKEAYRSEVDSVQRLLKAPIREIGKDAPSVWMDRLDAQNQLHSFSTGQSRLILLDLPFAMIFLTVTFLVGGKIIFVMLAMIALFALLVLRSAQAISSGIDARAIHDSRRDDFISEAISGIHTIKSLAMEPQMQRRLERLQKTSAEMTHNAMRMSNEFQTASALFGNLILIAMVTGGAVFVIQGQLTMGALACCTLLTSRVLQPVMKSIQVWMELKNAEFARKRSEPLSALPLGVPVATSRRREGVNGAISITDATVKFDADTPALLASINLQVKSGEIIGIKGGHASGKSSFLKLIAGDIAPASGQINVGERRQDDELTGHAAPHIAYVSQDAAIFKGTILENITMFRQGPMIAQARGAARLIGLEDDINRLPRGYDTMLGTGLGETLPAGTLQRISIARTLASRPDILLFDEANSFLDMGADKALREGLAHIKGAFTIILVSNRPSLLAIADRRFELRDGQLLIAEDHVQKQVQPATGLSEPDEIQEARKSATGGA